MESQLERESFVGVRRSHHLLMEHQRNSERQSHSRRSVHLQRTHGRRRGRVLAFVARISVRFRGRRPKAHDLGHAIQQHEQTLAHRRRSLGRSQLFVV